MPAEPEYMRETHLQQAADAYPHLRVQWRGKAPSWCDLGCRVCGLTIQPETDAVETGIAPFHGVCFDALEAWKKEHVVGQA